MIDWGKFKLGTVVELIRIGCATQPMDGEPYVGHIVGFSRVEYDDGFCVVLKVEWADGSVQPIHPNNVNVL